MNGAVEKENRPRKSAIADDEAAGRFAKFLAPALQVALFCGRRVCPFLGRALFTNGLPPVINKDDARHAPHSDGQDEI
jgi:hypothetical protein